MSGEELQRKKYYYKKLLNNHNYMNKKLIDISKLKSSKIRHEVLPEGFIERILKFKEVMKDVETTSLEETVSNFQRDMNPETELVIWESIASCYKMTCENNPNWTAEERKRAFADILKGTMC
jgi:hypothetical protein